MSISIALIAHDWRQSRSATRRGIPLTIVRLRHLLGVDERRRARLGTWPPPITLPKLREGQRPV